MFKRLMTISYLTAIVLLTSANSSLAGSMRGDCTWQSGFKGNWPNDRVRDMVIWDDGGGPALFIAGEFTEVAGTIANHLERWDFSTQ